MATKGYVVAAVVGFSILLIVLIVWLATSAGSGSKAPGSAGNWTAAQVAEQITTQKGKFGKYDLERALVDMFSDCYIRALSAFQTYDYTKGCSAEGAKCEPTEAEMRAISSCFGGAKKGNWSPELKTFFRAVPPPSAPPEMLRSWPCVVEYLALNYDLTGVLAALKNAKPGDDLTRAIASCMMQGVIM